MTNRPVDTIGEGELRGKNPWPENSDYGRMWRRGYNDGRSDALSEQIASFIKQGRARTASSTREGL